MTTPRQLPGESLPDSPTRPVIRNFVIRYFLAFAILFLCGFLVSFACYWVAGISLDLFFGGVLFAAIVVPPCSAIAGQMPGAVAVSLGVGCVWLLAVHAGAVSPGQWSVCLLVLLTFAIILAALVDLLARVWFSAVASSGIVTLAGLAWLSWPIWLSASLPGAHLHWSVTLHPLFAINHVVANLGIWTEQQVAYGLTNLGQDVQYQLPSSAWPVIGMQAALWVILYFFAGRSRPAEKRQFGTKDHRSP